ncbi:hypothetical protein ACFQVC_08360 [Streptomyces monticola]|uniref:Uncharacterized protein n=1 Tax=Streptomyces monticola TaxID=2666263 RepID=A0ABW2JG24_9ACTN
MREWSGPSTRIRSARSSAEAAAAPVLGPQALLAPELMVVLDTDRRRGRATARAYLTAHLGLSTYQRNFRRPGFTDEDVRDGGSDRLIDALVSIGDETTVRNRSTNFSPQEPIASRSKSSRPTSSRNSPACSQGSSGEICS